MVNQSMKKRNDGFALTKRTNRCIDMSSQEVTNSEDNMSSSLPVVVTHGPSKTLVPKTPDSEMKSQEAGPSDAASSSQPRALMVKHFANSKDIMSSSLPLLFSKGQPQNLATIPPAELDDFVTFMILCSLQLDGIKTVDELNACPVPEWWPQEFKFKFPLIDQNGLVDKHVMLKSLVCRCYTYYECEYLLKFSAELSEKPPNSLNYVHSVEDNNVSIFDTKGQVLVKCRNENLYYDENNRHRRMSLIPNNLNRSKRPVPLIDLTCDSSTDEEAEAALLRELSEPTVPVNTTKRKPGPSAEGEEPTAKRNSRRFQDFEEETPEPDEVNQELFLSKFDMIPTNKKIINEPTYHKVVNRKKRLAHSFSLMSLSSQRGQELLTRSKHSFNVDACLERIEHYCNTDDLKEGEANQVCTRASAHFSTMLKQGGSIFGAETVNGDEEDVRSRYVYTHSFKWPLRNRGLRWLHQDTLTLTPEHYFTEEQLDEEVEINVTVEVKLPENIDYV